jgi:hypothetical protein
MIDCCIEDGSMHYRLGTGGVSQNGTALEDLDMNSRQCCRAQIAIGLTAIDWFGGCPPRNLTNLSAPAGKSHLAFPACGKSRAAPSIGIWNTRSPARRLEPYQNGYAYRMSASPRPHVWGTCYLERKPRLGMVTLERRT